MQVRRDTTLVIRRPVAAVFAIAVVVAIGAWIATLANAARVESAGPHERRRAEASVSAARAALDAFDSWRAAAETGAARRAAALEDRFALLLDRAGAAAQSTTARGAVGAIAAYRAEWRDAAPLDARFSALEPALDEARATELRLHLAYLVEAALTDSLGVRRHASSAASDVSWTAWLAAAAAFVALGATAFTAIDNRLMSRAAADAAAPAAPSRSDVETEATRLRAARRLEALRAFEETRRRPRADLPFALRGASFAPVDG